MSCLNFRHLLSAAFCKEQKAAYKGFQIAEWQDCLVYMAQLFGLYGSKPFKALLSASHNKLQGAESRGFQTAEWRGSPALIQHTLNELP